MSEIVRTVTRWISVFVALYGLYLVVYGHLTPGGGFAGGVAIAGGYILLVLAFGKGRKEAKGSLGVGAAKVLDSVGAILFLVVAVLGLALGGEFFANFIQRERPGTAYEVLNAGTIPLSNVAIALKVAMCLFAVFAIMAAVKFSSTAEGPEFTSEEEE